MGEDVPTEPAQLTLSGKLSWLSEGHPKLQYATLEIIASHTENYYTQVSLILQRRPKTEILTFLQPASTLLPIQWTEKEALNKTGVLLKAHFKA